MVWNKTYPQTGDLISNSPPNFRGNWSAIQDTFATDHNIPGSENDGEHKKISFNAPIATPTNVANTGFLYTKDVDSKVELHCLDETGNETQLTSKGRKVPRTTFIHWKGATNTASVIPLANASVSKTGTGTYQITLEEEPVNFLTYGYMLVNGTNFNGNSGDDGITGFLRITSETIGGGQTIILITARNHSAVAQNADWKLQITQAS